MKRLSKEQTAERDRLIDALRSAAEEVSEEVEKMNDFLVEQRSVIKGAVDSYNEAVQSANEFIEQIHSDAEDYYSERSEKWQEGDAGSRYGAWVEEWSNELDEADLDCPNDIEMPDTGAIDQLEGLASEPN